MNVSMTNTTTPCPGFLGGYLNATVPYCALPLCANTTAVMAQCCAGSQVFQYHSPGGPGSSGIDNITDLNALWCSVDNSSTSTWSDCISNASGIVGMCAAPSSGQTGWASRSVATGLKTTVGLAVLVALFHSLL
ncbi:hypothetical protein CAC42_1729 [Sphaceloma murrayae]|uniref:Uncharacterized protein n=1 Tax=Sphaceloma murrayae TaxID=2082308 RepID=A0A2K1QHT2_9PEZI|nr:hypothetical protein CAC42_1729 [Sphaceloma murrayae]